MKHSLRKAIDDKCRECIYDPDAGNGTWRKQVEACTAAQCPLYSVRPATTATTTARRIERRAESTEKAESPRQNRRSPPEMMSDSPHPRSRQDGPENAARWESAT